MGSFDEDLNRQVLQRMSDDGDDLSVARPVEFSHAFPDAASAGSFAAAVAALGLKSEVERTGCVPELPWDVVVTIEMVPELNAITAAEHDLGVTADSHRGRSDGWGCIRVEAHPS